VIGRRTAIALRVLVSAGILIYLLDAIFRAETADELAARGATAANHGWWELRAMIWSMGARHLGARFSAVSPGWMALAIGLYGLACGLVIVRWQRILRVQDLQLPLRRTASIFFIGQFFNAFMLGATGGDVAKAWYVARETHHKKAEAITTIAVDRLVGLGSLLVIALVTMSVFHARVAADPRLGGFMIAVVAIAAGMIAVLALGLWRGFPRMFPRTHAWLGRRRLYATWQRVVGAYRRYAARPRVIAQAILLSFAVHVAAMLAIMCVGHGLGLTASALDYFLYLPIINTATAIPISIAGFGVREGMYVLLFVAVGVEPSQAIALSLLGHIVALTWSVLGAVLFLVHRRDRPGADPADEPADDAPDVSRP